MRVRNIDSGTGDWEFGAGAANYATGQAAAQIMIKTRLLCFYGDCFFDANAGIPWLNYLGTIGSSNQLALNLAISGTILNTPDENGNQIVTGLLQLSLNLNPKTRALSISYNAITIYSVITDQFEFDLNAAAA